MNGKQRLELTWIGKDKRPALEPRILMPDAALSHHAADRKGAADRFDNLLIQGDNLLALKALEAEFAGQVKCIYIDPPYNTGSAFEHYDDGLEHSVWLTLMRDRLEMLSRFLHADGSVWVSIDDSEMGYLRMLMDEIFGRKNFVATIIWEKRKSRENRRVFSFKHDFLFVYAKEKYLFEDVRNAIPLSPAVLARYANSDNDPRGPWQSVSANAQAGHATTSQFYELELPSGRKVSPPPGRCWLFTERRMREEIAAGNIWFGQDGNGTPRIKKFLRDSEDAGLVPETIWFADDVATNDEAKKHSLNLFGSNHFETPKPEQLLHRILQIATDPGDLVLDSFAGSGTTGAVAHKMGRRWIMVEQGDHAVTHIVPRLKKVIDGADPGGVTEACQWQGGGGYRFFTLAPSLCEKDQFDNWVISKKYDAAMLAEAVCKHMGFTYAPSSQHYWMHGYSSERDFIYVTTQSLPHDQLRALSDAIGSERSLLVCCKAFQGKHVGEFKNLTVKKIPLAILHRCEWGKDDYSMGVAALAPVEAAPMADPSAEDGEAEEKPRPRRRKKKQEPAAEAPMLDFDAEDA